MDANWNIDVILEVVGNPFAGQQQKAFAGQANFSSKKLSGLEMKRKAMGESIRMPLAVAPKATEPETEVSGYQVYRDGSAMQKEPQSYLVYQDKEVSEGQTYRYWVSTLYENGQTVNSDSIEVLFLTDLGTETPETQGFQIYASEGTIHIRNQSGNAYDVQVWSTGGQNMARSASVTRELLDIPMRHAASGI